MRAQAAMFGVCLALSTPAAAELPARKALSEYDAGDKVTFAFLSGVVVGFQTSNVRLMSDGHKKLFCFPGDTVLTVEQAMATLRTHLVKYSVLAEAPTSAALLDALRDTFPCQN